MYKSNIIVKTSIIPHQNHEQPNSRGRMTERSPAYHSTPVYDDNKLKYEQHKQTELRVVVSV